MSNTGFHNFAARGQVYDKVVRQLALERTDERFFADEGDEPCTKEQAYELGLGDAYHYRPRYREVPPLPVDALRAFDLGAGARDAYYQGHDPFETEDLYPGRYDPWRDTSPTDHVDYAHAFAESEQWIRKDEQEHLMWQLHEQGGVTPLFLTRAEFHNLRASW